MERYLAAISFDLSGTLIETAEPVGVVYARYARAHGLDVTAREMGARFASSLKNAPPLAFGALPHRSLLERERQWWESVVQETVGPCSPGALEAIFGSLFDHYAAAASWQLIPRAESVLRELRSLGLRTILTSNFDSRALGLLAGLGLEPLLDQVTISSRAGAAKPDPAIFRIAMHEAGIEAGKAAHVGDSIANDVLPAKAAGLAAIHLTKLDRQARPGNKPMWLQIGALEELPAALQAAQLLPPAK